MKDKDLYAAERTSKPGYPGRDAMREKGERIMGAQAHSNKDFPQSFGSEDNAKMRLFKKGGSVKKDMGAQAEMKNRVSKHDEHYANEERLEKMKKGGKAKNTSVLRKAMKGRTKKVEPMAVEKAMEKKMPMKKGGMAKSKANCYAAGGAAKVRKGVATEAGLPIKQKKLNLGK
jgi:hypothetical protein